jgi:hypothetical protein
VEEAQAPEKMASGYLSDGLVGRAQAERKKGEFRRGIRELPTVTVLYIALSHSFTCNYIYSSDD